MKKAIQIFLGLFLLSSPVIFAADCGNIDFSANGPALSDALADCTPKGAITSKVTPPGQEGKFFKATIGGDEYLINSGVRERVQALTLQIMIVAGVLAVGMIVISAILMIMALGDEKKLGESKNALKYSIVGFLCVLIAYPVVNMVINFIYGVAWNQQ